MHSRRTRTGLQSPESLDSRFGVVAGLYVAALLSPAVVLAVVESLDVQSGSLALGLLGTVGAVVTAVVAQYVTRLGGLISWSNSTAIEVLAPTVGIIPIVGYYFQAFVFVGLWAADLPADSAAPLIGFTGLLLGLFASGLGSALVLMARNRLAETNVATVEAEWSAGWPRRDRLLVALGAVAVLGVATGLAVWQFGWVGVNALTVGGALFAPFSGLVSERTYRVTPTGLEKRRETRIFVSRHLLQWKRFDGFSVTDDAVVLHRPLRPDIRCSRLDIHTDEDRVIEALQQYLDRRDDR